MSRPITRRSFSLAVPGLGLLPFVAVTDASARADHAPSTPTTWLPSQDPALVERIVGQSHRNLDEVKALVEAHPSLVNASWDWGFGDWETPLGAASHVGRREIALYLIERGARPDLFAWAMLGNLEAVRSIIEASPGAQRQLGPHGITLLDHAQAGGDEAVKVVEYLTMLGDADIGYSKTQLTPAERAVYLGAYSFGSGESDRFIVEESREYLTVKRQGRNAIRLFSTGPHEFHPAGAPTVRLRFEVEENQARRVQVMDGPIAVAAGRVS